MILRRDAVEARLKELDATLQELGKYRDTSLEHVQGDLSLRWILERGLIAAATMIFDIADQILAGHFGLYAETYEETLASLHAKGVISSQVYEQIRGLGGFRNILVHRYIDIDPREVLSNLHKGLRVFPQFAREVLDWLDEAMPREP